MTVIGTEEPLWPLDGVTELIVGGGGGVTAKLKGAEVPAGAGSMTYSGYVPGMGSCPRVAVIWVELELSGL